MNDQEIAAFLDLQNDLPAELRRKMLVHHAGIRPMWNVIAMRREDSAIIVVGKWNRARPKKSPSIVLRWYWTDVEIGVWWQSFAKADEVSELKIRIDSPHVVFERS